MLVSSGEARIALRAVLGNVAGGGRRTQQALRSRPRPRVGPGTSPARLSARYISTDSNVSASQDLSYPSHLSSPTPYDIFRLPRSTTSAQIKARYYDLVRCLHPDRILSKDSSSSERDKVTSEFKLVVQAYNLLKDPKRKELYDRSGLGWDSKRGLTDGGSGSGGGGGSPHRWDRTGWNADPRYTRRRPATTNPGWEGNHDFYGWQQFAGSSSPHSHAFYGFTPSYNPRAARPRYTSNGVFFSSVFIVTWFVAALQYKRISNESKKAVERADRAHLDAARNLDEARLVARSIEGRQRFEAYRRRAREQKVVDEVERIQQRAISSGGVEPAVHGAVPAIEPPPSNLGASTSPPAPLATKDNPWGIGHGGPSGKEAAERRKQEALNRRAS